MRSGIRKWRVQTERHTVFQTHQKSFSSPHLSSGGLVISHGVLECPSFNDPLFRFQFQFVFSYETTKKVIVRFRKSAARALRGGKNKLALYVFSLHFALVFHGLLPIFLKQIH